MILIRGKSALAFLDTVRRASSDRPRLLLRRTTVGSRRSNQGESAQEAIGELVKRLVLPQMIQSHRALGISPRLFCDHQAFIESLLANQLEPLLASINAFRKAGHSLEVIYHQLLTPVARQIGEHWLRDELSFSQVTLASFQIEQILHHFQPEFESAPKLQAARASVLISIMPGEQHSLGAKMLGAFFRKAQWDVCLLHPGSLDAVVQSILSKRPALIAVTVTQIESLKPLNLLLRKVRQQSDIRSAPWMIGGRVINDHPLEAVAALSDRNIHLCQGDASQALALAERLVGLEGNHRRQQRQTLSQP